MVKLCSCCHEPGSPRFRVVTKVGKTRKVANCSSSKWPVQPHCCKSAAPTCTIHIEYRIWISDTEDQDLQLESKTAVNTALFTLSQILRKEAQFAGWISNHPQTLSWIQSDDFTNPKRKNPTGLGEQFICHENLKKIMGIWATTKEMKAKASVRDNGCS